jgi:hypothetical protein
MNVQSQEQVSASWDLALGDFASLWSILSKAFGKLTDGASPSPSNPAVSLKWDSNLFPGKLWQVSKEALREEA